MPHVPLVPRQVLFGDPAYASPSMSPSGTHLTYLAPHRGELNVWIGSLLDRKFRPLTDLHGRPINDYLWARDGRHLLYLSDHDGDEDSHLIAIDLAGGDFRDLTPYDRVRVTVVGLQSRVPGQVVVTMNLASPDRHDLYRLDLADGGLEPIATEPGLTRWVTDPDLRVRAAQRDNVDGGTTIVAREDEGQPWHELLTLDYADAMATQLLGFTGDGKDLLLLSPVDAETVRLLRLSVVDGSMKVLYEEPDYDVSNATVHPLTGRVDLVTVERERPVVVALRPDTANDLKWIRASSRGVVVPLGRDAANRRWLVQDNVDNGPAAYRLYDRETSWCEVLFTHQPELSRYTLATMEPFSYTARDGLVVHGYLTFPPGPRRDLPTVLVVHGGPWDRNRWGFRGEPQWLANRGYLCVEVNFRGSSGYGRGFLLAGDHEWGGRMQDDLIDAVHWVIDKGYADPDRLAVSGASYGGYAALVAAAFTPELFRCAVAVAAPVNLRTFVASIPDHWKPAGSRLTRRIGDPSTEPDFLWSRSPLSRAGDIRAPLLLGYGRNDGRVPVSEAEQLVKSLRANGVPHRYVLFEDEGHGFHKTANALVFRAMTEEFLAEHLGGRCEPAGDPT
jgi:dipeptidyl aminopeptidase/acylaminoacyl peptidase